MEGSCKHPAQDGTIQVALQMHTVAAEPAMVGMQVACYDARHLFWKPSRGFHGLP